MKKKILLTALTVIIAMFVLAACTPSMPSYTDSEYVNSSANPYEILKEFTEKFPSRTAGSGKNLSNTGEDAAALWIAEKLNEADSSLNASLKEFVFENANYDKKSDKSYNVIGRKTAVEPTDKTVVIGANYDNAAELVLANGNKVGGEGVYGNAGGVAALIETAAALSELSLPYNVEYVAFGAGESNAAGSGKYIAESQDDIILMVNYNKIVGGEYLYMYSDEVKTLHNDYFYSIAESAHLNIAAMPKYVHNILNQYISGTHLMYYKEPMLGDHIGFTINGISVISYTSANYNDRSYNYVTEYAGKANIYYTGADTLLTVVERYGGGDKGIAKINDMINTAVTCTVKGMTGAEFMDTMAKSKESKLDYSVLGDGQIMQYIGLGISAAVLLAAIIVYFALKSKAKAHPVYRVTPYGVVEITSGTVVPKPSVQPVDPFEHDDEFKSSGEDKKESSERDGKKAKDVDKKDIFDDF